jgi:hypothetical protein
MIAVTQCNQNLKRHRSAKKYNQVSDMAYRVTTTIEKELKSLNEEAGPHYAVYKIDK